MHRLFVALPIPDHVAQTLLPMQCGLEGAKWRPRENFHITLAFIGAVDPHMAGAIDERLSAIEASGFSLNLQGTGFFKERRPRAVWAGVAPSEPLVALQAKVARALIMAGAELEVRKFTPHVTLAYLSAGSKKIAAQEMATAQFCAVHFDYHSPRFEVSGFTLYEAALESRMSIYEPVRDYRLGEMGG